MNIKNIFRAAALVVALAFAASIQAQPASTQPPTTQPAGNDTLVIPALAPPRAQAESAAESAPVVVRLQPAGDGAAAREAELLRKLLAGPPEAAALSELVELRNRQLRRDADALDALAALTGG